MVTLLNEYPINIQTVDPGKKGLLTTTTEGVTLWGYFTSQPLQRVLNGPSLNAKFSSLEKEAYILKNKELLNFSLEKSRVIKSYESNSNSVLTVSKSRAQLVACGTKDSYVKIWDTRRRFCIKSAKSHPGGVSALLFKENFLISAGSEGSLKKWDLRNEACVDTISKHERILSLACNNHELAVLYEHLVRIYDLKTYETTVSISVPDAKYIEFWNNELMILSQQEISSFSPHNGMMMQTVNFEENLKEIYAEDSLLAVSFAPLELYNINFPVERRADHTVLDRLEDQEFTKVVRLPLESRAFSERSVISLDKYSVEYTGLEDSEPISKVKPEPSEEDPMKNHLKFMTIIEKRSNQMSRILDEYQRIGLSSAIMLTERSELVIQGNIFSVLILNEPRCNFINIENAEAFLEISLRLVRSKNMYLVEIGAKSAGVIFQEVSMQVSEALTSKLSVAFEVKDNSKKIYFCIKKIAEALRVHNRGFLELNDFEFYLERIIVE